MTEEAILRVACICAMAIVLLAGLLALAAVLIGLAAQKLRRRLAGLIEAAGGFLQVIRWRDFYNRWQPTIHHKRRARRAPGNAHRSTADER